MKYVFVIAYGRSGSTLLQTLLNSALGGCIRGENNGFMLGQFQTYRAVREAKSTYGNEKSRNPDYPWYGIMGVKEQVLRRQIRELALETVIRPTADHRFCGFKEIRHLPHHVPDMTEYIDFMSRIFPGARFIFNTRNPETASQSGWWKHQKNAKSMLTVTRNRFQKAHKKRPDISTVLEYETLLERPVEEMKRLADFLEVQPPSKGKVRALMDKQVATLAPTKEKPAKDS